MPETLNLRVERERKQLTQSQLARAAGVPQQVVSMYELRGAPRRRGATAYESIVRALETTPVNA